MKWQKLAKWHKTKLGYSLFGAVELGLAYIVASIAIERGNLLYYMVGVVFLVGALQNFAKLMWKFVHEFTKTAKTR